MFFSSTIKQLLEDLKRIINIEKEVKLLNMENKTLLDIIEKREEAINRIVDEKSVGFPWLANAIAEFYQYKDEEIAYYLENKSHPAHAKATEVRHVATEKKEWIKKCKELEYLIFQYESLFPELKDYVDEDLEPLKQRFSESTKNDTDENEDPVLNYITREEYDSLPSVIKNQIALDRYYSSKKKPYQIGRDYERYVGYLYEKKGYKVNYFGIKEGLSDLGRDLICTKDDKIEIVQCKYWKTTKTIHEKHVNQLYGTVVQFFLDYNQKPDQKAQLTLFPDIIKSGSIKATLYTSTSLSDTALKFADVLGITVYQNQSFEKYPVIKCNINSKKEKIYHLPFDQQYDNTMICKPGECYVTTVREAEDLGFRRAYRWSGNIDQ